MALFIFRMKGLSGASREPSQDQREPGTSRRTGRKTIKSVVSGAKGVVLVGAVAIALVGGIPVQRGTPQIESRATYHWAVAGRDTSCAGRRATVTSTVYLLPANAERLPNFSSLRPYQSCPVEVVGSDVYQLQQQLAKEGVKTFGIVYSETLWTPGSDWYTFTLDSDDGSRLFVDEQPQPMIDYDGPHAAGSPQKKPLYLKRGNHRLRVEYFECCGDGASVSLEVLNAQFQLVPTPAK